jgi:hypothetical protein
MSFLPSLSPGNVTQRLPTGFKFDNDLTYNRPTGWLDLGINAAYGATGVPEKVKGLVAVYPSGLGNVNNYLAFNFNTTDDSHLFVDWGDGNPAETGHQSDFSSDVDGYSSNFDTVSRSASYEGKSDVLLLTPDAGGRVEIQNNNVDILSGNNHTITFEYNAATGYSGKFWGMEDALDGAGRLSISTTQAIVTGAWSSGSLFVSGSRPSSSSTEILKIRPQDSTDALYGTLSDSVIGQVLAFKNIKVVLNNSGSGYYVKENTTNHHVYDYDIITGDTSTAKSTLVRGYKQAIFEFSLQGSAKFSSINFNHDGPYVTNNHFAMRRGPNVLDLFVSSSNCVDQQINNNRPMRLCEQMEIRNTSSNRLHNPRFLYQGCRSLQSIPFVPWIRNDTQRDYLYAFYDNHKLKFLPDEFASQDKFWFKNMSRLQQCFEECVSLQYLPEGLFGNSVQSNLGSCYQAFRLCLKLKYIPYIGLPTGSNTNKQIRNMFSACASLTKIPKGIHFQQIDANGLNGVFTQCSSIKDYSSVFDGTTDVLATINRSTVPMQGLFREHRALLEIPFVGQFTKCSDASSMFYFCRGARKFSPLYTHLDFSNCLDFNTTFNQMSALEELPEIKVRSLTNGNALANMFGNSPSLLLIKFTGMIALGSDGEYHRMFNNCHNLAVIDGVDFSFATEASDYYQTFHLTRNINAIKFPGTFRAGYASPRINVTVANHADISGEYHITADGTGYAQASGNGVLTVAESSGNYTWTIKDSSDDTPTESSSAASNTQFTPWAADWSGATNAVTFTEVATGFKYTVTGNSGDGLRYSPIKRAEMLEIFNQLVTISHSATLDIRNNSFTADLTDDDKAIATNKGWTLSL